MAFNELQAGMGDDESHHCSPEYGLPSLWWREDDCFCVVQLTSESVAIGRMDDAQITIGIRDPGMSAGTFPSTTARVRDLESAGLASHPPRFLPCSFFASLG